ncbi:NfeD family protein [Effusibacillus pohliae]|uniref:NfeD family protein n=1 Tax=Effusibacillus pohliae TaxID=232270 RepID=UPI000374715E|nr:NfeD family protein [Effusibacillus pohliae]
MAKLMRILVLLAAILPPLVWPIAAAAESQPNTEVYVVPVENTIETGLAESLQRAFQAAEAVHPHAILLRIDTLGGNIGAAMDIGKLIRQSKIPVIAYVERHAISAGAYIALNAKHLAMAPGSTIGAAEPRTVDGKTADPKTVAVWKSEMAAAAEATGRSSRIAEGMVDVNLEIPGLKAKGELLSLTAEQAVREKIADGIFATQEDVITHYGYHPQLAVEHKMSFAEKLARIVTHPYVIPILLIVGIVGLVVELLIPGVMLPGIIGGTALVLFFFGHIIAGFAGWESLLLFLLGAVLLVIEMFVPSFGLLGVSGIAAVGVGVGIAVYDAKYGIQSFLVALLAAAVAAWIAVRYFGRRGVWNRLILQDRFTKEAGYVPVKSYNYLLYQEGAALTPLRPAGTAVINGQRFDVVTEGGFINAGEPVTVVHVEGVRIVVRRKADTLGEAGRVVRHKSETTE